MASSQKKIDEDDTPREAGNANGPPAQLCNEQELIKEVAAILQEYYNQKEKQDMKTPIKSNQRLKSAN